jgi:hypothetical protein
VLGVRCTLQTQGCLEPQPSTTKKARLTSLEKHFHTASLNSAALQILALSEHVFIAFPSSFFGHLLRHLLSIIFVHGLHGHPRETWQASSKRTKVFWPKDLLAPHLSSPNFSVQARILSFGYNSCHLLDGSKLRELTNHLAQEVLAKRSGSAASRQIIWIAHSLGGVLVKAVSSFKCLNSLLSNNLPLQVLKLSHRFSNDDFGTGPSSILRATIGVIFLGTPHQVSSPATWMNYIILASGENPITNLGGVKVAVEDYQRHAVSFRALLDHQRIIIVSFYESKPTPTKQGLIKVSSQAPILVLSIGYLLLQVVDELTALNHSLETIRYIEGNHRTICQFTDDCQVGYIQIRRAIVEILKSGVEVQGMWFPRPLLAQINNL